MYKILIAIVLWVKENKEVFSEIFRIIVSNEGKEYD
jgi:hypothetical protein